MIIGKNSNNEIYKLLLTIVELSDDTPNQRIQIEAVNDEVNIEVAEFKKILGYLTERGWISADSIGGPLLYDQISLTPEGLEKAQSIRNK